MRQSIRVGSRHRGRGGHRYITPLTALTRLGTTRPARPWPCLAQALMPP